MENAGEIIQKVKKREYDFAPRYARMDQDFDLWNLQSTQENLHETDVDIISNNPRTFANKVQSILSNAEMQISIRMAEAKGEDKRGDIGVLERLFYFALEMGDRRLIRMLQPPLRDQLVWYSIIRGWVAGRFLVESKGKDVIFNFNALDPRWLTYEVGSEGLLWVAYKTFRSPEALFSEYGKELPGKPWYMLWKSQPNNYEVIDYWKRESPGEVSNAVICQSEFLKEPERYQLASIPILIIPVATRPPVVGGVSGGGWTPTAGAKVSSISGWAEGGAEGYGDSIFAANRGIYKRENEAGTIWATHTKRLAEQPLINYYDVDGEIINKITGVPGSVLNLPMRINRLEPSPLKEISPTLVHLVAWIGAQRERGSLPDIEIGKPPPSGTLYNLAQEAGNTVFNPHIRNLNYFYADICRLIEEQLLTGKIKVDVKTEEERKYFETQVTPIDLKKPHIIKVEFTATNPWTQLDVAQHAEMLTRLGLPRVWIWENILRIQDPKLLQDLEALEIYEHSPQGMMKRAVEVLMDRGYIFEARKLVEQMDRMEMQEQVPQGEAPRVPEMPVGEEMMPLGGGI